MRSKKRFIIGLVVGVAVFAAAFGMAATLGGLNSDSLGADNQSVAACDTDGVTTSYDTDYSAVATAGFKVTEVTVGNIGVNSPAAVGDCAGMTVEVALTGAADVLLESKTAVIDATSESITFNAAESLAESVTGVHVVIYDTP